MSTLLLWLSLGYAAVLVVAVAVSLVVILLLLRRVGGLLREVGDALAEVREHTSAIEPLMRDVDARIAPLVAEVRGGPRTPAGAEFTEAGPARVLR